MKITKLLCSTMALSLAGLLAAPAMATQTIKTVVIDGYPAKAMWVSEFSKFFIPNVNKRLAATGNYKIDWQESYGGSIVKPKGVLEGVKLGLGDIGIVTTIFHSSKLPSQALSAVTPFIVSDARVVAKAVDEIAKEFPTMQKEFAKQNQVYLSTGVVLDTYQVFSENQINNISDLEGSKVAGAGMNLRYLEGINNAAGVRGGLTNFYNMLQTGLVEHAMLWPEAANTFKVVEVAPYMLQANLGAVNTKTVTANANYWKKLPQEVKDVMLEVSVMYRDHVANRAMSRARSSIRNFQKEGGVITKMTPEEQLAWANSMPNIAVEWATALDKKGEPGSEMLKAYINKLARAGYSPIRDWSTELP